MDGHVVWKGVLYRWACSMDGQILSMVVCCIDGHVLWMGISEGWTCGMDGHVV